MAKRIGAGFGYEMESLQGKAGRVPTANLEAFQKLAWKASDMEALLEQYAWVRGIPQVPGGYYSWRNVNNAFYTVTTGPAFLRSSTQCFFRWRPFLCA